MSENAKAQASISEPLLQWEDWVVLLTGGMITTCAIGWIVYRSLKSQQLDYKTIMTIVASFGGGMSIYFTGSGIILKCGKSSDSRRKSITTKKDESKLSFLVCETSPCKRFVDEVNEFDGKLAYEASKALECKDLDKKKSSDDTQEAAEVPRKSEDMSKRLNDLNRQELRNRLKLSTDNQMETCYKEGIRILKVKFREEIISYINELKGYVQGTIDPLPSARNFQFRSSEISDEMCRQVVVIVKEYANNILPKLEQVIDDFMDSVCKLGKVHNDREHKVKKTLDSLDTDSGDRTFSIHEKNVSKISELPSLIMPRLATPSIAGIPFMCQGVNKPDHRAVEKLEIQRSSPPVKLTLNREQMKFLNILKSEL